MAAISDFLENKFREHIFKATAYSMPTVLAISLHTADPTDANNTATEVPANGNTLYARQTLNPHATQNWTKDGSDSGKVTNASDITFPAAGVTAWGTITHVGIYDASSGGNLLFSGALANSKVIGTGDIFKFLTGDLAVTFA